MVWQCGGYRNTWSVHGQSQGQKTGLEGVAQGGFA